MLTHAAPLARLGAGLGIGVAAGIAAGAWLGPAAGALAGWAVGALLATGWILLVVWPMDADQTRAHATREDPGRRLARLIAFAGSMASLGAVALVLLQSSDAPRGDRFVFAALAVLSVVASWALIQTDYMLRYARMYYTSEQGGISFNGNPDAPAYTDFVYFSVGLGMTYQVADTNVRTNAIRRVVIAQTMLAYLFGAVILATVVNLLAGIA
ncbi:MAG: DUF1345 domain-containing protein [Microbacterium sp.]|uniref:DUF1345 domain-containing protein n=1 Tax=Microbacterium sp. TaxID=51671 RepID=UPI0039E664C3